MNGNGPREQPAGGLGATLAGMFVRASTDAKNRAAPIQRRVAETAFNAITNHVSDEVRTMVGWLFRTVAEHPETPDDIRGLFKDLGNRRGQAMAWIGGTATGAALGGGLMNLLTNYMNPSVLPLISADPNGILTPSDAAQASVRGLAGRDFAAKEASYSGISGTRFAVLERLATTRPTLQELHVMLNRGEIQAADAAMHLRRQGYEQGVIGDLMNLRTADLSPEVLAQMWNRDIVTTEQGRFIARRWGMSSVDFDRLTALGGEPPATQELLLAWRRGVVDEGDVNRALVQGPLRKEWIPVIKQLQWEPLSPTDAADSVNQGHLGLAEAQREASFSGVRPEHFRLMIENAGLPPGLEFASEAYNRGLLTDAQWTEMFLESRIKNRYIPLMRAMRTRIVPQETIRLLWREGVYSDAEAIDGLMGHGFSRRDATALLQLEKERRSEGTKELTRAQLIDMYEEDVIDEHQVRQALASQGYDATEVEWQVSIADVNRNRRFINSATTRVKSAYVTGRIDETEANGRLTELGYGPQQKDNLVALWTLEREVSPPQLTVAQITAAAKKELITWEDAEARLLARGYDPIDAAIVLALAGRPQQPTQGGRP